MPLSAHHCKSTLEDSGVVEPPTPKTTMSSEAQKELLLGLGTAAVTASALAGMQSPDCHDKDLATVVAEVNGDNLAAWLPSKAEEIEDYCANVLPALVLTPKVDHYDLRRFKSVFFAPIFEEVMSLARTGIKEGTKEDVVPATNLMSKILTSKLECDELLKKRVLHGSAEFNIGWRPEDWIEGIGQKMDLFFEFFDLKFTEKEILEADDQTIAVWTRMGVVSSIMEDLKSLARDLNHTTKPIFLAKLECLRKYGNDSVLARHLRSLSEEERYSDSSLPELTTCAIADEILRFALSQIRMAGGLVQEDEVIQGLNEMMRQVKLRIEWTWPYYRPPRCTQKMDEATMKKEMKKEIKAYNTFMKGNSAPSSQFFGACGNRLLAEGCWTQRDGLYSFLRLTFRFPWFPTVYSRYRMKSRNEAEVSQKLASESSPNWTGDTHATRTRETSKTTGDDMAATTGRCIPSVMATDADRHERSRTWTGEGTTDKLQDTGATLDTSTGEGTTGRRTSESARSPSNMTSAEGERANTKRRSSC